jgi:transcriptional regulator with XRE-family HTH domain
MFELVSFGSRLRELRTQAGLSREQLAQIVTAFGSAVKISARTIEGLEQGRYRDPGWISVQVLAKALGVTPNAFMVAPASSEPSPRGRPMSTDIMSCLPNWSDRHLRWLIDHLARLNEEGGRYTVMERRACEVRDERKSTHKTVGDCKQSGHSFVLVGVEGHEFGRFKTRLECEELAATMGLGVHGRLDYFGHAIIRRVSA